MKVLLATAYYESHRGGIEIVAGRLARELQRVGTRVTWLACDATAAPSDREGCGNARPVRAWNMTEQRLGVPLPLPGPRGMATIWHEVRACDVVLMHDALYPTNVTAMLAARWYRRPVVLVQHIAAIPYSSALLRGLMALGNSLVARPMLAAADQVVFISETVVAHFATVAFKAPPRLIFNGVDVEVFTLPPAGFDKASARAALGLPAQGQVVAFVGRFVEKKGLHIIERLARSRPDLVFALAGWGPIDPRSWGLPNVHVMSNLSGAGLVPLYQSSDAFVLPSIGEGLPLVIQEALACGLPVICGRETANADPLAAQFLDGVEIDGGDAAKTAAAFAAAIEAALADPARMENGDAARTATAASRNAYVCARYNWTQAALGYVGLMQALVDAARVGRARPLAQPRMDRS